jgi:hypothetical protein
MAFSGNGDVFVADGYCNRRIMQYTADGTFIRSYTMANVRAAADSGAIWSWRSCCTYASRLTPSSA